MPYGHWRTMTFLAVPRCDRIDAPRGLDQPINARSLTDYVEQRLDPTLSPDVVVIIDNLSSYKNSAIRRAIKAVGSKPLFLPPCLSDLNPIKQVFAKHAKGCRAISRTHLAPRRNVARHHNT